MDQDLQQTETSQVATVSNSNHVILKRFLSLVFLIGTIAALSFLIYWFYSIQRKEVPIVDNSLIQRQIETISARDLNENDPFEKAKRLFDLASLQLLYRSENGEMQRDAIRNLEEAYVLVQGDRSVEGKQLVDKINLTRLVQFSSLIHPFENFDLTQYEVYLNGSGSLESISTSYALALLYMIDFSDNYFYSDDDKAVRSIGMFLKAVALDYFSSALTDTYKESLVDSLDTRLSAADVWKNEILPERPLVSRVMSEAYELYAASVLDEYRDLLSRDYGSELSNILTSVDTITSDPIQQATVKLNVLRVAVQTYENVGQDPTLLKELATRLSEVSTESKIMFDIFFGTSPELVNVPQAREL